MLVLELHTNDAIARELDLSVNTVRNHIKAGRDKLGGLGRYDAARRLVGLRADSAGPSGTGTERTMEATIGPDDEHTAVGWSGGTDRSGLRQPLAVYDHDDAQFGPLGGSGATRTVDTASGRMAAVLIVACAIALLIVATPPMAASFVRLARMVEPLFR